MLPKRLKRLFCTPRWQYSGKEKSIAEGVWRIWNETPIRQNRASPYYGKSLECAVAMFGRFDGKVLVVYPEGRVCVGCEFGCAELHRGSGVYC